MAESRVHIGVWGVFGQGNFGNEATLDSFLRRLGADRYDATIFCENPEAASELHGLHARSIGGPADTTSSGRLRRAISAGANRLRFVRGAFRAARSVDAIVVAGSGALELYGSGTFGWPFEMWALAVSARLARRPFLLLDVGAQSHPSALARFFIRGAANRATYRSYRDGYSRDAMRAMGVRNAQLDPVVTDMAFTVDPILRSHSLNSSVVLGVMDYRRRDSSYAETGEVLLRYEQSCVQLVHQLHHRGRQVRIVVGAQEDLVVAWRIVSALGDGTVVIDVRSPDELVAEMASAAVVVASRYHTLIMALIARTPVVSIGYGEKHRAMLEQFGLTDMHRDIESFDPEEVAITIEKLDLERAVLSSRIGAHLKTTRGLLEDEWRDVDAILQLRRRRQR